MIASKDFIQQLKKAREEIRQNRPAESLKMALDVLALMKLRIQGKGEDFEGNPFVGYNPIYAKYGRERQGYQSGYVDFTRKGRMWANISPSIIENTVTRTVVETGARDQENQKKLAGQVKKRGNILTPSDSERNMVAAANAARVRRIFQTYFNQ